MGFFSEEDLGSWWVEARFGGASIIELIQSRSWPTRLKILKNLDKWEAYLKKYVELLQRKPIK